MNELSLCYLQRAPDSKPYKKRDNDKDQEKKEEEEGEEQGTSYQNFTRPLGNVKQQPWESYSKSEGAASFPKQSMKLFRETIANDIND